MARNGSELEDANLSLRVQVIKLQRALRDANDREERMKIESLGTAGGAVELAGLRKQLGLLRDHVQKLEEENDGLNAECERLMKERDDALTTSQQVVDDNVALEAELAAVADQRDALQQELDELRYRTAPVSSTPLKLPAVSPSHEPGAASTVAAEDSFDIAAPWRDDDAADPLGLDDDPANLLADPGMPMRGGKLDNPDSLGIDALAQPPPPHGRRPLTGEAPPRGQFLERLSGGRSPQGTAGVDKFAGELARDRRFTSPPTPPGTSMGVSHASPVEESFAHSRASKPTATHSPNESTKRAGVVPVVVRAPQVPRVHLERSNAVHVSLRDESRRGGGLAPRH